MVKKYTFYNDAVTLYHDECLAVLRSLPDNSLDSIVTDPPYHLASIVKRFGKAGSAPAQFGTDGAYKRASTGFMGQEWDGGDIAFTPELWTEVYRVLKPGGHLVAFAAAKNYHRMAVAIEDSGFEIRDQIMWLYGSAMPKSHDVSKGIDKAAGAERKVIGTAKGMGKQNPEWNGTAQGRAENYFRPEYEKTIATTSEAKQWEGWGSNLKPAHEPLCLARKPLSEKTVAANVLKWGTGALNIDASRVKVSQTDDIFAKNPHPVNKGSNEIYGEFSGGPEYNPAQGRWPANIAWSAPEDEYELKSGLDEDQKKQVYKWLYENA